MWMMDCNNNNHGKLESISIDPVVSGGRKLLRPLMPRPTFSTTTPSCRFCTQNSNILSIWNHHHHHHIGEYGVKREVGMVVSSTRWNPTPEQLQALEELYRRGTRTPSAEQIQQIAARLRRFGKIEGKNVFYWFQNHKARERQKKRRHLEHLAAKTNQTPGVKRRYFEIEHQDKKLATEDSVSMNGSVIAEGKKGVWTQMGLQQQQQQTIKNEEEVSSWKLKLDLSFSFNNNNFVHAITNSSLHRAGQENTYNDDDDAVIKENHDPTLQLFPTGSVDDDGDGDELVNDIVPRVSLGYKIRPSEFIEFLPIK